MTHTIPLRKNGDLFIFRYEDGSESALIDHVTDLANDPYTKFDWSDCAAVAHAIGRNLRAQAASILKAGAQ